MRRKTNRKNCRMITRVLLPVIIFCFFFFSCYEKNERQNPFESIVDELYKIDQSIICFREIHTIPVPLSSPLAIAAGPGPGLFVTGDRKLIIIDEYGRLTDQLELDENAFSLAVHWQGSVYLGYTNYVEKINLAEKERFKWAAPGDNACITSVSASSNYIFVADAGNRMVLCYNIEGNLKKLITGEEEDKTPHFMIPSPYFDIAACPDDTFWVTNPGRFRVEHWSVKGDLLKQWGSAGGEIDTFCGCCNPAHIALFPHPFEDDSQYTTIVTAEKGIPRVKLYKDSGNFRCVVAPPVLFRTGTKGLDLAAGVNGRVYVLDHVSKVVRVFESKGEKHGKG